MKPPLRTKSVGTKVSEEEFAALEARARARKVTLSEWVRAELLLGHSGKPSTKALSPDAEALFSALESESEDDGETA